MPRSPALALVGLLAGGLHVQPSSAAEGGPDAAGYTWRDTDEAAIGRAEPAGWRYVGSSLDDDTVLRVSDFAALGGVLPWAFPFYGASYDDLWISDNGWVSFVDPLGAAHPVNRSLPEIGMPRALIAPLWDDLLVDFTPAVRWGPADGDSYWKVDWRGTQRSTGDFISVELLLYRAGCMRFHYDGIASSSTVTIGTEDETESVGTLIAFDGFEPVPLALRDGYALAFCPPGLRICGTEPVAGGNVLTATKSMDTDVLLLWTPPIGAMTTRLVRSGTPDFASVEIVDGVLDAGAIRRSPALLFYRVEHESAFHCMP